MSDDNRIDDLIIKGIDRVEDKVEKVKDQVTNVSSELTSLNAKFGTHEELFKAHLETDQKMYEEFSKMNTVLGENTQSLKEHMMQTNLVREATESVKNALVKIDGRLTPIEEERLKKAAVKDYIKERWKMWLICLGAVATLLGIISKLSGIL